MMGVHAKGLAIIRILIGIFFLFEGIGKLAWLTDSGPLAETLAKWAQTALPANRWYLQQVALPGAPVFARAVALGELSTGVALILGFWTRLAAALAFLMVMNFHFASGLLFQYRFLTNGYGLPVAGSLLGLAVGGTRLPYSLRGQ